MTGNHTVMGALAVALGLAGGLGTWWVLRRARRRASVHADLPATLSPPADTPPQTVTDRLPSAPLPTAPLPTAPFRATVHYTDARGEDSVREVVIHSRILKEEHSHAVNIREGEDTFTKRFLIERISRLEYTLDGQRCSLTSAERIRELLEQVIPLKGARPVRKARQARVEPNAPVSRAPVATPAASPAPAPPAAPLPLPLLLPEGARGFAVIDLETTGFGAEHRILEIAVIRLEPDGRERDVWETLVHPGMPIPRGEAQRRHRIHDRMVVNAPSFDAVAGELAARLDGHVLVAHNLPFDQGFLERRFEAVDGIRIDLGKGLNTMKSRESLENLCRRLGVELPPEEAHCALVDARALRQALLAGISHLQPAGAAVRLEHNGVSRDCVLHTRQSVRSEPTPAPAPAGWRRLPVPLTAGAEFIKTDVADACAEDLADRLELMYRKAQKVPVRRRPAFLLAEDLSSTTTKMRGAREQGVPVLLLRDLEEVGAGATAMGWVYAPGEQEAVK